MRNRVVHIVPGPDGQKYGLVRLEAGIPDSYVPAYSGSHELNEYEQLFYMTKGGV